MLIATGRAVHVEDVGFAATDLDVSRIDTADSPPARRSRGSSKPCTKGSTSASSIRAETATLFANPYLKLMFGYAADAPPVDVRPFEPSGSSIHRRATQFLERLRATVRSPTICCGCGAPTAR